MGKVSKEPKQKKERRVYGRARLRLRVRVCEVQNFVCVFFQFCAPFSDLRRTKLLCGKSTESVAPFVRGEAAASFDDLN